MSEERARAPALVCVGLPEAVKLATVAVQLGLLVLLIRQFRLESEAVFELTLLATTGWLVHSVLPFRYRLPFFSLLSLCGVGLVLGVGGGMWLVGIGLFLISVCHLPARFGVRVGILLAAGAGLALLRAGALPSPVPAAVWPVLGSIFMFRLAIYLYDLQHGASALSVPKTLSYFFLLPNPAFPLFPVVDYKTFERTYYSEDEFRTYRKGVKWMFRGVVHLVLYRVVYHHLSLDVTEVVTLGDMLRHAVTAFLLYLRVSGQFHLIVGMLHLFGFALPETHHRYLLSASFTDLWRRINIYWKDFMLKLVYYPSFFHLRRYGNRFALIAATVLVFIATWALHSYQWFWLLGRPLVTAPDILFWVLLGGLVVAATLRESAARRPPVGVRRWSPGLAAGRVATVTLLCLLWSLWTSEGVLEWLDLWSAVGRTSAGELTAIATIALAFFVVTGFSWGEKRLPREAGPESLFHYVRSGAGLSLAMLGLLALAQPSLAALVGGEVSHLLASLRETRRSHQEEALEVRGYYEDLNRVPSLGFQQWDGGGSEQTIWKLLTEGGALAARNDFLLRNLVPLASVEAKGHLYAINRWGMRDRDYEPEKQGDTYRVALLGQSTTMGWGVDQEEDFESLVEERLNNELAGGRYQRIEVLNFAVPDYAPLQSVKLLEEQVARFEPDAVFIVLHPGDWTRSLRDLTRLVKRGVDPHYPELRRLVERAEVDSTMTRTRILGRLRPYRDDLARWAFARLARVSSEQGAVALAVAVPLPSSRSSGKDLRLDLAEEAGLQVIDLLGTYEGLNEVSLQVGRRDMHPNAEAHRLLAARLFDSLWERRTTLGIADPAPLVAAAGDAQTDNSGGR